MMPISPNSPEGALPPQTFNQSTEVRGRGVGKGSLRKVAVDDSSLDSKTPTSNSEHPYIRLYQYLHQQQPRQQGAPPDDPRTAAGPSAALSLDKAKGGGAMTVGANGSGAASLRPAADGSSGRTPSIRAAAPRPPSHRHDNANSPSPQAESPIEASRRPSTPPLAPPPEPPVCRRGYAPLPPSTPGSTPPLPTKPPPSPNKSKGGSPTSSTLALPPSLGDEPQRHNSLSNKRPAPFPGGNAPARGLAPLPPPASPTPPQGPRHPPPVAAPPTPPSSSSPSSRVGIREAPPPPNKTPGSPAHCSDPPTRAPPPPPPTRNPAAPPPPPPPIRNGHSSTVHRSFADDFESKYSFHSLDDFPPPDEYKHFTKIYPSRAGRVMRGAPPLPPVGR